MSSVALPCVRAPSALLLVEPQTAPPTRAAQLGHGRFRVTQANCASDIFVMRNFLQFTVAVLSDEIGAASLCASAEIVRVQWPSARILILGRIPAAMGDQLYDDVAVHAVDETALLLIIDKLAQVHEKRSKEQFLLRMPGESATIPLVRAVEPQESDPTKTAAALEGVHARGFPSGQYRSHRRGYYAFPPTL